MLTNVWSTPRTGSVWYSHWLQSLDPESILLTEPFNRYHYSTYRKIEADGSILNYNHPVDGGFYIEYFLEDGKLNKRLVYDVRVRDPIEEEKYIFDLIKSASTNQKIILHNHIEPINEQIREWLIDQSGANYWIYRKDRQRQLASYTIALETRNFATFKKTDTKAYASVIHKDALIGLIDRIKIFDKLCGIGLNSKVVAFEDIKFYNSEGLPYDQNEDPWLNISSNLQNCIIELLKIYGL